MKKIISITKYQIPNSKYWRFPNTKKFWIILLALLIVSSPVLYLLLKPGSADAAWSASHGSWAKRKQLTLVNNSGSTLNANVPYQVTIDTKTLYQSRGDLQNDCDDLRIVYQPDNSTSTELARDYTIAQGATDCSDSGGTIITFPLQANITNGSSSTSYYMYYANPTIGAPNASRLSAYNIGAKTATFVAPFNGTTTALAAGSGTPTTATGAIRYSGGKSALNFDGLNDRVNATSSITVSGTFTAEAWINLSGKTTSQPYTILGSRSGSDKSFDMKVNSALTTLQANIGNGTSWITNSANATYSFRTNTWYHIAYVVTPTGYSIYINGTLAASNTFASDTPLLVDATHQLTIGDTVTGGGENFGGLIDEVRISNISRYSSNFSPQAAPLVRDSGTSFLYHFDENGDDPRNTGKAIDDSGNANHGTITGAKYVAGLVGVDASTTDTGNTPVQSYAGHKGVYTEGATTNLINNPSFENATFSTNWGQAASNLTVTQNTTAPFYKFGSNSAKIIASATDDYYISATSGSTTNVTLSAYVYDGTSGNIGGTVSSSIATIYFAGSSQTTTYTDMGGGWWRLNYLCASACTSTAANYGVHVLSGKTVYVDGVQLEALAYPTSYTDGSLGSGYSWSGTANASTSTRTAENIQYSETSNFNASAGSFSVWVKPNYLYGQSLKSGDESIMDSGGSDRVRLTIADTNGVITFTILSKGGAATISPATFGGWVVGKWYHIVGTWDASAGKTIYVNNIAGTSSATTWTSTTMTSTFTVGRDGSFDTKTFQGVIADMRAYSSVLSSTDVGDLYNAGLGANQQGSTVEKAKPVLNWKLDEGQGTTANDSSKSLDNGTLSNSPTWQTEDKCISSKCLAFDGSNDYVSKSYFLDNELDPDAKDMALSAWFRHSSTISGTDTLLARYSSGGYKVYMNSSGFICFGIDDDSSFDPDDSACSTVSYADSKWHQVTAVKVATTSITLYIDGVQVGTDASIAATGSISGSSPTFYVGIDSDGSSNPWDGSIDDVEVYGDQLSSAQVLAKYNAKAATAQAGAVLGAQSPNGGTLSNGLVGYWKMDESSWTNDCSTSSVLDSSGNGNNGKACPNSTGPTGGATGEFGNAGDFDGSDDYVEIANNTGLSSPTAITVSAWVRQDTGGATRSILSKRVDSGAGNFLFLRIDTNHVYCQAAGLTPNAGIGAIAISNSTWTHVACSFQAGVIKTYVNGVLDTTTAVTGTPGVGTGTVRIGASVNDNGVDGKVDEVRFYNRALSPAEVSQLYNFAPGPVGYWKMDEGSGTTVNDSSGYGNNSSTFTGDTAFANGKFGKSLSFDGNDDVARVVESASTDTGATTDSYSVGFWFKTSITPASNRYLVAKWSGSGGYPYIVYISSSGQICFNLNDGSNGGSPCKTGNNADGLWHHVTAVRDVGTDTLYMYFDGVLAASTTDATTTTTANNADISFGNGGTSYLAADYTGYLDDVKIYNYARTQKQIIEDMNGSHPAPGSPVGSTVATWRFDEGYGTTANDSSINSNNLTLSTASWTTAGKYGKAWNGTGSNWLSRADDDDLDFAAADDGSISLWFKSDSASNPGATEYLVSKGPATPAAGYAIYANTSGNICFGVDDDTTFGPDDSACSTTDIYDNTWHYILAKKTGTSRIDLYVDGKPNSSDTSIAATGTLANSSTFYVGDFNGTDNGNEFNGDIDELKVYRSALTDDQVKLDFNRGQAEVLGAAGNNSGSEIRSASQEYCVPGDSTTCTAPVGKWDFDEKTGSTANDTSGAGLSLSFSGSPTWVSGKYGGSLNFNGSTDFVGTAGDDTTINYNRNFTLEAWVYQTSQTSSRTIISHGSSGWALYMTAGVIQLCDSHISCILSGSTTISPNTWNHIVVTVDNNSTANIVFYLNGKVDKTGTTAATFNDQTSSNKKVKIGSDQSDFYFAGKIDQAKVFDYARTAAQIAWDYNQGDPIAQWRMDECSGTAINDSSGNSNTGTLTVGATGTQTTSGTCNVVNSASAWYNGKTGKKNYSLNFDGTDDYVDLGDLSFTEGASYLSWAFWYKPDLIGQITAGSACILCKGNDAHTQLSWGITQNFNGGANVFVSSNGNSYDYYNFSYVPNPVTLNTWVHIVAVYDGTQASQANRIKVYFNGKELSNNIGGITGTIPSSTQATTSNARIGSWSDGSKFVSGQIDDVRVYNYALTAKQVQMLYGSGAVGFNPATGAP